MDAGAIVSVIDTDESPTLGEPIDDFHRNGYDALLTTVGPALDGTPRPRHLHPGLDRPGPAVSWSFTAG